jgi:hypothetical protein
MLDAIVTNSRRAASLGRESPDIATGIASLDPKSDPSPRPSPLRKGRGGIVVSSLASRGSGAEGTGEGRRTNSRIWTYHI